MSLPLELVYIALVGEIYVLYTYNNMEGIFDIFTSKCVQN